MPLTHYKQKAAASFANITKRVLQLHDAGQTRFSVVAAWHSNTARITGDVSRPSGRPPGGERRLSNVVGERNESTRRCFVPPMNRIFLAVITSALLLLLTSASLLVYRAATPSGETAEVAKRHTTVGVKR